jgi:hypothetical protein
MKTVEKKERLLKAKIAVALQDEYKRVPTEDEINSVFHLTRVMYNLDRSPTYLLATSLVTEEQ